MRYKCGKGDPRGVVSFLDSKGIRRGVLPRYRGNRLHILFHISGKLIEFYDDFLELLNSGTSCGGLRSTILHDFKTATAKVELQVLGLLGKHLTGPWMTQFYTDSDHQVNHIEAINIVHADLPTSGNQKLYSVIPKTVFSPPKLYFIIKTIFWGEKKSIFARGARITSTKSFRPGSRDLRALEAHGFKVLSGAILALFLNIIQKLWPSFHK